MRTFTIEFEEHPLGDTPGVRIYCKWSKDGETSTKTEDKYASVAKVLINILLENLPIGECVAAAKGDTREETEAKTDLQLDIRRAAGE